MVTYSVGVVLQEAEQVEQQCLCGTDSQMKLIKKKVNKKKVFARSPCLF